MLCLPVELPLLGWGWLGYHSIVSEGGNGDKKEVLEFEQNRRSRVRPGFYAEAVASRSLYSGLAAVARSGLELGAE